MKTSSILFTCFTIIFSSCSTFNNGKESAKVKKTKLYYGQGTEMLVKKEYSKALEYLLEAQKLNPKDSEIQNNLGMAYYFKKRSEKAKSHLKRAIELDPKNSNARNNYASILFREGNYKEAKHQYQKVKEDLIYPHQYRTYYNLALIEGELKNNNEMIRLLHQSIAERDDFCPSHYKLGELSYRKEQLSAAIKHFKNASKGTCYKYPAPIYYQAIIWQRLAAPDKAAGKLTEILNNFEKSEYAKMAKTKLEEIVRENPEMREQIELSLKSNKNQVKSDKNPTDSL